MAVSTQSLQSLSTIFLDQPPSCLEFCPLAPNYLVIGTYLLSRTEPEGSADPQQSKTGSLQLFQLNHESAALSQIQSISVPHAVFDLHFSPRDPTVFAIATSAASVSLYKITELEHGASSHPRMDFIRTITVHDDINMPALYFAWLPPTVSARRDSSTDGFAVSFSDGQISIFHNNAPEYELTRESMSEVQLANQPIEMWYLTFHSIGPPGHESPVLFSGDDLSTLHVHEFATDGGTWTDGDFPCESSRSTDRGRNHNAGITSILPLFDNESGTFLLTGSYDEHIRVIHSGISTWKVLAEESLGGGVWRLKLLDSSAESTLNRSYLVLASCMHAGARIVRINCSDSSENTATLTWNIHILHEFTEHKSMNYASDVFKGEMHKPGLLCVSSSFYDKRVCLWNASI